MADWNLPALTSNYTDFLNFLKNRDENSAKMFDGTTDINLPTGTKRWSSANARFEKWSGSAWDELVTLYNINVSKLGGEDSAFYRNASNLNAGTISTSRIPSKQIPYNAHELSSSEDLDDIRTAGFYYQSSNSETPSNNYPVGQSGSLLVQKSAGSNGVTQIYTTYLTAQMYTRSYYNSWTAWREVSANTWRDITDSVSSTSSDVSASAKAVKTAYDLANSKLGATAKAVDSDKLDNLDSTQFVRSDVDDETSAKLRVGGSISGQAGSSAILQVNGVQRTGDVFIHETNGNNLPTNANKSLHNEAGVLQWDGNKIWHAGNDGSGSGLDADKLDNLDSSQFLNVIRLSNNTDTVKWDKIGKLTGQTTSAGAELSFSIYGVGGYGSLGRQTLFVNAQQRGTNGIKIDVYSLENGSVGPNITIGYVQIDSLTFDIWIKRSAYNPCIIAGVSSTYNGTFYNTPEETTTEPTGIVYHTINKIYHTGNIPTWNQDTTGNAATATNATKLNNYLPNDLPAGIGVNQTWVDETSNRADGTTYTNTSDKPITILIGALSGSQGTSGYFYIDDNVVALTTSNSTVYYYTIIVPSGSTYKSISGNTILKWHELK